MQVCAHTPGSAADASWHLQLLPRKFWSTAARSEVYAPPLDVKHVHTTMLLTPLSDADFLEDLDQW